MNNIIPLYPASDKILIKSKGCYQYDSEGHEYIDFESGVWCANLGHSHNRIVEIIEKQAKESIHQGYRFRNIYSERLSKEIQELVGFENGASVFLSSGSEAVNLSITIAQRLTKKKKILRINNSYLSAFGFGQIQPESEYLIDVTLNDLDSLSQIDFKDISALVLETGGASIDMVQFPNFEFVQELVKIAKSEACIIIAEEVTTGIGRLGKWFGFQHYNIKPDIVVTGKALGNGYPISAITINSSVLKNLNNNIFRYAQSHQNDPLGCAIGLEVIKIIKEDKLIDNCISIGQYFKDELFNLQKKYGGKIKEIRAKGLMLAVELQDTIDGEQFNDSLFNNGFVFGYKLNTLRFLPPLIITSKEIDKLILKLDEILKS